MSPSARNPGLDAEDARVEDAVIAAAIARGVITAGQAASARDTRDAASARGEASTLLGALASSLDPGRREQLRQLREVTVSQAPRTIAGDTTRLDPDAPPAAVPDATRWTDATAVAFGRGVPAELGGATRRFTDVLRPDAAGGDQTFLSWDGRGEPPPRGGDDAATIADPPRRGAPRPGTVLGGRFEVLSELGRGGMGAVFRAVDRQAGVEVALKLIMDELGSPERRERFLREGEIAAGFEHPGIVRVHAVGELDGRPFVACELVLGCRTLDQVLPGLGRSARIGLVRDAARALGHAHARGVAHRDVKPQNLLVDDRGRLKVADFGLALTADHDRLTRTGVQLGTPSFMAPEQVDAAREAQGPRTDVWALGVILYEALCGRRPFQAPSFAQLCVAITRGAPPAPRSIDPTISPALDALVLSALQVDPALRPQDGEAVAQALDRALADRPSAADLPALRAPASDVERIGPYEVVRPIGEGGAGIVYEARAQDGRRVALKVLHPQAETEGSEQVDRFGRETSAASRLRHPGIAQVLDSGTDAKGRRFIALELVPGETLHARLKRERTLDEREAARLAAAIARALEHAHGQGVLHRDVKPHNVLLAPDGPKLVDFGLARSIGDSTLTAKGAMLGTPGYLPPEQAEKQASIDARADVYGVGATLYHMLTGRPPFIGDTLGQVLMAVLKKPAVRPSTLRPGLAPALDTIVLTCLEKERDDRYPGPAALADDLERFLRGEVVRPLARATGQRSATSDAAEPAPRAGTTDRRMLALASGVVVAALAGAAVIVWRTNEAAERQREVERLAQAKAESDAELERVRAEAARDHEAAERARADAEARDRARAGPGPPEQPRPDPARTDPTTPDPPRPDPPPEHRPRGRGESSGSLRFERDVSVLGLRPWLSRRLAAARIWGRGAPGWAFSVDDAQHEAGKRGVPLVVVMLAPDLTELPSLLRDPALLAEVNQRAAIVLLQHRDKHLHDEVVDGRALDCGNWPGRDDQVCPIARTAPCEIHDRCEEQWERGGGLPLRPGERWRVLVLDPRSTGCADFGEGEPPPTSLPPRSPTTADALRDALRCAEGDAGPGVRLDALCDAQVALSAAALPETAAPDVTALGRSADAFAPHLGEALLAGAFSRWAEVELERVVSGGRKLLAATPAAGRAQVESDLRAALAAHPSVIERILAP